jgi:hypothetical protein
MHPAIPWIRFFALAGNIKDNAPSFLHGIIGLNIRGSASLTQYSLTCAGNPEPLPVACRR